MNKLQLCDTTYGIVICYCFDFQLQIPWVSLQHIFLLHIIFSERTNKTMRVKHFKFEKIVYQCVFYKLTYGFVDIVYIFHFINVETLITIQNATKIIKKYHKYNCFPKRHSFCQIVGTCHIYDLAKVGWDISSQFYFMTKLKFRFFLASD